MVVFMMKKQVHGNSTINMELQMYKREQRNLFPFVLQKYKRGEQNAEYEIERFPKHIR